MAFFDWNMDGKIDVRDTFLEYMIIKSCTEEGEENENIFDMDDLEKDND